MDGDSCAVIYQSRNEVGISKKTSKKAKKMWHFKWIVCIIRFGMEMWSAESTETYGGDFTSAFHRNSMDASLIV